jgi:hypothetical protein
MKKLLSTSVALITISAASILSASPAHAQGSLGYYSPQAQAYRAAQNSLSTPIKFAWGFETGFWQNVTMKILDTMVNEGVENLQTVGEVDLSQQMQKEWQDLYVQTLATLDTARNSSSGELGTYDLGDHAPLFQWLENYTEILNQKTRGIAGKIELISDLTTLNYALPIVFQPAGSWRAGYADRAWVEYRLHFIPFANIMTYWGAYEGCKYEATKNGYTSLKNICDKVADKLDFWMGRYLAPRISDFVFKEANPGTVIDDSGPTKPKPSEQHFSEALPASSDLAASCLNDNNGDLK